jgi:hypothetical protein
MIALAVLLLLAAPRCFAGDEERDRQKQPQTYESPILSLLFLPANVLIKMASVFGPKQDDHPKPEHPRNGSSQ